MWAIVWVGYSYAAIARQFLIYDPEYPWYELLLLTKIIDTFDANILNRFKAYVFVIHKASTC
jgi:hypothetical protein